MNEYNIDLKYNTEFLREMHNLNPLLLSAEKCLFELREQLSVLGRITKPHFFNKIKKDIARIKTIIKESKVKNENRTS